MPKLQWMKWYPADWINDTRSLTAEAKGCWMDILMLMWNAPERGTWSGDYQEFARVTGIPWESAPRLIQELRKVATVTERDNLVTLLNRRMSREGLHYKSNAIRQKRFRSNAHSNASVTPQTPLDSSRLQTPQDSKTTSKGSNIFKKPSAGDVTAYGLTLGFKLDGSAFCDFYESKGWKVGNTPMKDWQAAVRTWKKNAPPSAMVSKSVYRETIPERPMTDKEQQDGLEFARLMRETMAKAAKDIPR